MLSNIAIILFFFIYVYYFFKIIHNKIWIFSPFSFHLLYIFYYVIIPHFSHRETNTWGYPHSFGEEYLLWGTLIYTFFFFLGLKSFNIKKTYFKQVNNIITINNMKFIGMTLFAICFVLYVGFKGFSLTIFSGEGVGFSYENDSLVSYITGLSALFPAAACLLYPSRNKNFLFYIIVLLSLIIYIIAGFRFRLVLLVIPIFCFIHLYPQRKPIKWVYWIPLIIFFYISMGVIEKTRSYGRGLDLSKIYEIQTYDKDANAGENLSVYHFSAISMKVYSEKDPILFEPIWSTITFPIPRSIFPSKPNADYLKEANYTIIGNIKQGAAFMNIAEAYLSFGWIGIIVYGLTIGFLANVFWTNYIRHSQSIGAIILLSTFNGLLFVILSRGYMPATFMYYIYYIILFCWFSRFLVKIYNIFFRTI